MKTRQVEILAPAGSYESMTAAVAAGADAVYIGGSRFGARAYADNLDEDRMRKAIDYMHLHGGRLYMTVNTLMKEKEMEELFDYLNPFYKQGLDGVIVQDMGVFSFIREYFPKLPIHASTQMTVTGVYGARLLKALGARRIVTARELSLEEIREIRSSVDIEIESFVHGALCYCYSGQCLLSSVIGGRSGNRGRCAQPCRLPYEVRREGKDLGKKNERYVMSLKDLCTLDQIPDIIEAGVYSMKIEGRMKSPRYTAGVVSMYRKYVDRYLKNGREGYYVEAEDKRMLLDLFDRGGFTEGYYTKHNGRDMIALHEKPAFREANQPLFDWLDETYVRQEKPVEMTGKAFLKEGEPVRLELQAAGRMVTVYGQRADTAQNQPVTEEKLLRQIGKTGGSGFAFTRLSGEIEGRPFIPLQALNELRRNGLEKLEEEILREYRRKEGIRPLGEKGESQEEEHTQLRVTASVERAGTVKYLTEISGLSRIYIDSNTIEPGQWKELAAVCHEKGRECWLIMPHIFRTEARKYFEKWKKEWMGAGFDGLLLRSMEEIEFLKEQKTELPVIFDSSLYAFNRRGEKLFQEMGAVCLTLPAELNERELACLDGRDMEMIVYGYQPLMVSAQCFKRTAEGCSRQPELLYIKDRMGKEFPVRNHCRFCYNTIYNISPLSLHGLEERVKRLRPAAIRLAFTIETDREAAEIAEGFARRFLNGEDVCLPIKEFTRGHFKRGVE